MDKIKWYDKALSGVGLVRKSADADQAGAAGLTSHALAAILANEDGPLSQRQALQLYSGWSYACIRAIEEEIANMEFQLYRVTGKGYEAQPEHELLDILEAVNESMTGYDLRYLTAGHLEAIGNAYWYLEGVKNETGKPVAIHPLVASRVRVNISRNTFPGKIESYEYEDQGRRYTFQPYEIVHIRYPDPSNPFVGIGTVQAIASWIQADNFAMEFNRQFFKNGTKLGYILESEASNEKNLKLLQKTFEATYQGLGNAYKGVVLPKGTKYTDPGSGMKDLDFANLLATMQNKILAGFRVPRTVLGITDDVNRANAETTDYVFIKRTIKPKMQQIVGHLNEKLVPRFGADLYLTFKDPVPENEEMQIKKFQAALGNAPWMSLNEAREAQGLDKVTGGESIMAPFGLVPVGSPEPKQMNTPATKVNGKKTKSRGARIAESRSAIARTLAEFAAKEIEANQRAVEAVVQKGLENMSDTEFEPLHKAFLQRVTPYEKLIAKKLREHNSKEKEIVLENLAKIAKAYAGSKTKAKPSLKDILDEEEMVLSVIDLTTPAIKELFKKEAKAAATLIGTPDLDVVTPQIDKALDHAIELMAGSYEETTLKVLRDKLEAGILDGLSMDELTDLVSGIYEWKDTAQAETVARTESFRVANSGARTAYEQSGVVKSLKWYTAADELVCEFCGPMHGKIVDIDQNFYNKGETIEGSAGGTMEVTYDDVSGGALHPNCRCQIRPEKIQI